VRIAIAGTGYVGLVTGTCFAEAGNEVTCFDINESRVDALNQGRIPIFEPGLTELVISNHRAGRLKFTTSCKDASADAEMVYLAVGTPQAEDGSANLSAIHAVVDTLAQFVGSDCVVVTKSTVPIGTNRWILNRLNELLGDNAPHVASNPEFLREGCALKDFQEPDRVVVGVEDDESADRLRVLYEPFLENGAPFLTMGLESAEMTKYAANCFLATKISFINEMANVCDAVGANIDDVQQGIGHDHRIGFSFLNPGVGYGGSCFPKDVRALQNVANVNGYDTRILQCVDTVNTEQKDVLFGKLSRHFAGDLSGKTIAVWGLAFKPGTDDIREAPSLTLIRQLLDAGAAVRAHDPEAVENVRSILGDQIEFCDEPMAATVNADALAVVTEWRDYKSPDFSQLVERMNSLAIFDGRNMYSPEEVRLLGFSYYGVGRQ
jgi:UDPglucose 6-dehydrogenase